MLRSAKIRSHNNNNNIPKNNYNNKNNNMKYNNNNFNNNNFQQRSFNNNNPFKPRVDIPVPMEVDQSIQTKQVNYVNRPPRNFNIQTNSDNFITEQQYFHDMPRVRNEYCPEGTSFERYCSNIDYQKPREQQTYENPELNFLE